MKKLFRWSACILIAVFLTCSFHAFSTDAQGNIIMVTANGGLNLRAGPGTGYKVVNILANGSRWYIYGSSNGWLNLGNNQWVSVSYTKQSAPMKVAETTARSGLNVRKGPGTSYSIIRVLPLGTRVDVLEVKNGWYRIANGISGKGEWISASYTRLYGSLDNTMLEWFYIPNENHMVPAGDSRVDLSKYDAHYAGNITGKVIYLTFDLGYEAGYTPAILDTLKRDGVKATFFVTKSYIDDYPDYIRRMVDEGHTVGNHTNTHPSLPSVALDQKTFNSEIQSVAEAYKSATGKDMVRILRPPMGDYSELSLYMTQQLGYRTIFWSFGYYDYDTENQPDEDYALGKITGATHNGAIMLLHGVSKTNTDILDSVIKEIRHQGYSFDTLDNLK